MSKLAWSVILLLGTATLAAVGAPYLYAEYALPRHGPMVGPPLLEKTVVGRWFDDYYLVEIIDENVFAIGEPRYYQGNYSYLIVGTERAVLFDAGSGNRDLVPVVRSLTRLPVTVVPSHLHFDHVGALGRFERTALLDDAGLRARAADGWLRLRRYEFLGFADRLAAPRFHIDDWWPAGATIDLGGRSLTVLSTPGHTPTSVSLYDAAHRLLFCGDFVYPGPLYAFVPGASRGDYAATAKALLAVIDPRTSLLTAHLAENLTVITAPRLDVTSLRALTEALDAIDSRTATASGIFPRVFPVDHNMTFETGFSWNTR